MKTPVASSPNPSPVPGPLLARFTLALMLCAGLADTVAAPADNGPTLSATGTATQDTTVCSGGYAPVSVQIILTTTGSVDSAIVTRSVDGGSLEEVATIQPTDFIKDGQTKTAEFSDNLVLPAGFHTVQYCFTQSGSPGKPSKQVCTSFSMEVVCDDESDDCGDAEFYFGNILNNPVLCNGKGNPSIPVHLKAVAEGDVVLTITGPNGFAQVGLMRRAGASCVYQFVWDTSDGNNGGVGDYTFEATDANGQSWTITNTLSCEN